MIKGDPGTTAPPALMTSILNLAWTIYFGQNKQIHHKLS